MAETPESTELEHPLEVHRPLVRETDKKFSSAYGFGGGAVLAVAGAVIVGAWALGWIGYVATWVVAITVGLIGLFILRAIVNRRRRRLRGRVEEYCELNGVDAEELREYYAREDLYPYFEALFEERDLR